MKTLAIFFFFTIAATFLLQTTLHAQSYGGSMFGDSTFTINSNDSIGSGVIIGSTGRNFGFGHNDSQRLDSLMVDLRGLRSFNLSRKDAMPRYKGNSEDRYYLNIVPPTQKGKRIDHSNIWLLKQELGDAAEIPPTH